MSKYMKDRNQLLDVFRVLLILMVVAIHVDVFPNDPALSFYTVDGFFRIAVPIFFIINGYYFQTNVTDLNLYKRWLVRVLILFVSWQVIYLPMYIPYDGLNARHLAVFISEIIFGYHHLWYISAMAIGGIGLYYFKDIKYGLHLSVGLFILGLLLQYSRVFINIDSTYYKILSQYWIFRNGLFFGFPMMYIGSFIAKNSLIQKSSVKISLLALVVGLVFLVAELTFSYKTIFNKNTYHIDFILSLLVVCPVLFVLLMKNHECYFKGFNTKKLALLSGAMYFVHPYIIFLINLSSRFTIPQIYMITVGLTLVTSLFLLKYRKKLHFLF
ncbi:surface polysaccharide O-acyltransferase-like enzyme [Rahnella sp. BIGb0603]|uniref:acyltransferase family protein n=1 Tax=Rahnella sp. BIGb0603 TaxID=2940612 RepID=UPI002166E37E|nr:acyltransferase [Rahnella sp. BIGb0603]MCS3423782.1 surface polysaccharide O-acyltransferase-like enzyme [Rahnella sp. BIGb0603]